MPGDHQNVSPLEAWFLDVPSHWEVLRLGSLGDLTSGATPAREEPTYWGGEVPWVSPKDMKSPSLSDSLERTTEDALRRTGLKLIPHPAILFVVRGMILAHTFPVARTLVPVTINQDMKALRLRSGASPHFIAHLFSGSQARVLAEVQEAGHGTRRLPMEAWKNLKIGLPPIGEQQAIADFLDRETAKIDHLIEQKERLIDLLRAKRTALITRAVTRGLDPNVELKDSGVAWLGELPDHWDQNQLGRMVRVMGGGTPDRGRSEYWGGEIVWVSPKDMKVSDLHQSEESITSQALSTTRLGLVPPGAILIVVRGMILDHSFPVAVARVALTINQDMKALVPRDELHSDFLAYVLKGLSTRILTFVDRAAHGTCKLATEHWKRLEVPVPPREEQEAIAEYLQREERQIEEAVDRLKTSITLLREYRTALISAAVTGKIDVREHTHE